MPLLRALRAVTAQVYQPVIRANLELLRKGTEMAECESDGCQQTAELVVTKWSEISEVVKGIGGVTRTQRGKEVCCSCAGEMQALYGWEISGAVNLLRLAR